MTKMWRIGKVVQKASSFLCVFIPRRPRQYLQTLSLLHSRLPSSPPRWLLSLLSAIRTCSKIPTSPLSPSSHRYLNNFRTPLQVTPVALRAYSSKVTLSLPYRWYLSTQSGFSVLCSLSRVRSWPHFCNNGLADTSRLFNETTNLLTEPVYTSTFPRVRVGSESSR